MTTKNIKVAGVKKAVGDYKRLNAGGVYDPVYGYLMLDCSTGKLWTDAFYSMGHNDWKEYHNSTIINLVDYISTMTQDYTVDMSTIKEYAEMAVSEYNARKKECASSREETEI